MNPISAIPLGLTFSLYGIILIGTGLTSATEMIRQTLGQNINLGWGVVQLRFGLAMLFLSRRKK